MPRKTKRETLRQKWEAEHAEQREAEPPIVVKVSAMIMAKMKRVTYPNTRWAIYQNMALDSSTAGHRQFLAIGPDNTYHHPPECLPDGYYGPGWKYRFAGWATLEVEE